jgi:hypothetical protein
MMVCQSLLQGRLPSHSALNSQLLKPAGFVAMMFEGRRGFAAESLL